MTKPKIHVALLGNQKATEHLTVKRRIDELVLVYPRNKSEIAVDLIEKYTNLGIIVVPVRVVSNDFNNVLSSILRSLNNQNLDDFQIEFSIASDHCVMITAATVAAAIVNASVICASGNELFQVSEVWPSELVNLTQKKREILEYLEGNGSPVPQKEISKSTEIRQSGVSRHLRDLEKAGYVKRTRVARNKHVQITELGSVIIHHKKLRKRRLWSSYATSVESIHTVG